MVAGKELLTVCTLSTFTKTLSFRVKHHIQNSHFIRGVFIQSVSINTMHADRHVWQVVIYSDLVISRNEFEISPIHFLISLNI